MIMVIVFTLASDLSQPTLNHLLCHISVLPSQVTVPPANILSLVTCSLHGSLSHLRIHSPNTTSIKHTPWITSIVAYSVCSRMMHLSIHASLILLYASFLILLKCYRFICNYYGQPLRLKYLGQGSLISDCVD